MKKLLAIFAALCMLALPSCKKSGGEEREKVINEDKSVMVEGGTLSVSIRKPDTFNPICTAYESCRELFYLFYDPLFALDDEFSAVGNLAESYTPSEDALSGTLKIKQGITFSDGSLLTAEDVIYTVNFIREHPESYGGCLENLEEATALGTDKVLFTLKEAERHFESMLTFPIIKKDSPEYMDCPVGTGQFYCSAADIGYTGLVCKKNSGYHLGRAYLDGFKVSYTNTDLKAKAAFNSGETDILVNAEPESISGSSVALTEGKTNRFEFLGFNCASGVFASYEARRAVYEAVGSIKLLDALEKAQTASLTPINPNAWFYSAEEAEREDPKMILERNGWTMGASGVYQKDGVPLKFKILVNSDASERLAIAKFICGALIEYGVSADVLAVDYEEYARKIAEGEFDAFIGGTAIGNAQNPGFLIKTGGSANVFGYSGGVTDLRTDVLSASADSEAVDESKKFIKAFAENAPLAGLYFKSMYVAAKSDLKIPSLSPTGVFLTAYTWYMTK